MQENVAQANGYTWDKIVTSDGLEGYVANQYLNKDGGNDNKSDNNNNNKDNNNQPVVGGNDECNISGENLVVVPSTTVANIKSAYPSANVSVKNTNGNVIGDNEKIGTGYIVTINNSSYIVVKKGDANGDADVSSKDYIRIKNYIMNASNLTDPQKSAADANCDGVVNSKDYIRIKNYIMGSSKITIK